jgi:biopolymer transport protein TolR
LNEEGFMSHKSGSKELNFELNLLPVISMLSVCICFLLLTAVWTHIGTLGIQQALGQESTRADQTAPSLWVTMKPQGEIVFSLKDMPQAAATLRDLTVAASGTSVNWQAVDSHMLRLHQAFPNLKTALIMPQGQVPYGNVIHLMDHFKQVDMSEVGIAPM